VSVLAPWWELVTGTKISKLSTTEKHSNIYMQNVVQTQTEVKKTYMNKSEQQGE